jgi:nicotinamidase-related amidase
VNLEPSRTAVLALHLERDIIEPSGAFGVVHAPMIERNGMLEHSARLLAAAREHGVAVVYARVAFDPGHPGLEPTSVLHRAVLESGALVRETPGTEIVEALAPAPGDAVIDHVGTSAFVGGELARLLADRGIDTVLLLGVTTNVIVEGTARDAGNAGLRTYVLEDCTAAADEALHSASLQTLAFIIDGVVGSDEVVAALDTEAA